LEFVQNTKFAKNLKNHSDFRMLKFKITKINRNQQKEKRRIKGRKGN
jgi:hypothetical protein